jgi:dihydroorotase
LKSRQGCKGGRGDEKRVDACGRQGGVPGKLVPDVTGTITAHHLYLTGDNSQTDPLAFCKPIPKKPSDRDALVKAVCSGDPKFFL